MSVPKKLIKIIRPTGTQDTKTFDVLSVSYLELFSYYNVLASKCFKVHFQERSINVKKKKRVSKTGTVISWFESVLI